MKSWFSHLVCEEDVDQLEKFSGKTIPMRLRKNRRTKWTEEEKERLKSLFEKFDGDIDQISKNLRRGERSVRMNLFFMGLISEDEVDKNLFQNDNRIVMFLQPFLSTI